MNRPAERTVSARACFHAGSAIAMKATIASPTTESLLSLILYFDVGRWICQSAASRRRVAIDVPVELTRSCEELPSIIGLDLRIPHRLVRDDSLPDGHAMLLGPA